MTSETNDDIERAPAPWDLKAECYTFLCPMIKPGHSLPDGSWDGLDGDSTDNGTFIGGPSGIMLLRYFQSPVGPYDELIYIPGRVEGPGKTRGFQVTRIYVSSKASTYNGRLNWNIPKHVARFVFSPDKPSPGQLFTVSIYKPDATEPFFSASIRPPSRLLWIGLPATTSILGSLFTLIQPPLRAGDVSELVATDAWKKVTPRLRGSVRKCTVLPNLEGPDGVKRFGDGVSFPDVRPWIGVVMKECNAELGAATEPAQ